MRREVLVLGVVSSDGDVSRMCCEVYRRRARTPILIVLIITHSQLDSNGSSSNGSTGEDLIEAKAASVVLQATLVEY